MHNCVRKKCLIVIVSTFLTLFLLMGTGYAQHLYPFTNASNPAEGQVSVLREKGRMGLVYQFQYLAAGSVTPMINGIDLTTIDTVSIKIGTNPPIIGLPLINPTSGNVGYHTIDTDGDNKKDAVKIFYNGDFPINTEIQMFITGANADIGGNPIVQDDPVVSPNIVTFTTGNNIPRTPVNIELVFDISGSMGSYAVPGGGLLGQKRMDVLKKAVLPFFSLLNEHSMLGDKLGVAYFSTTASVYDPSLASGTNLEPAHDPTQMKLISDNIQSQIPTNLTSIGDGLHKANASGFSMDTGSNKKFIILFSDGEQNAPPLVEVSGNTIQVGGVDYPADIEVLPVTSGQQTAPGFSLQQDIGNAQSKDIGSAHTLDDEEILVESELETFYSQIFTNIISGDKLEVSRDLTGRIVRGSSVYEKFYTNTNDIALSILLSWFPTKQSHGEETSFLPFRLKTPDGTVVNLGHHTKIGVNMSFTTIHFPFRQNGTVIMPKGEWEIELLGAEMRESELRYHLVLFLDNKTFSSEFRTEAQDVGTGEVVPVRVRLNDAGTPVLGATVVAQIIGPKNGVGDILSTTSITGGSPVSGGDNSRSKAQEKLSFLLNDPSYANLFENKTLPTLMLLDNGQAANGDGVAGDGEYSALFPGGREEGHYHFLINARGNSAINGEYQRSQKLSIFVRPKAVEDNTDLVMLSSSVQPDGSVIVLLRATPRDAFGNFIGPDYIGHLNIISSEGTIESPLEDKLDGTYEISYRLPSTSSNPNITHEVMGTTVVKKSLNELEEKSLFWWILLIIFLLIILFMFIIWLVFFK
ncbi:MAG: VWA domain-containing protein [Planctomycetes bacterium]|nr:VWA domain-containing protein [Planctomycetota bacterium]